MTNVSLLIKIILISYFFEQGFSYEFGPVPYSVRFSLQTNTKTCTETGWSCSDCSSLRYCDINNNFDFKISCSSQFPNKPFCNPKTNQCDGDKNVCDNVESDFVCSNKGIFPDVTNCRRYISCSQVGKQGKLFNCLFQSVYNPSLKRCITRGPCYTPLVDCGGKYKIIQYKPDHSMYVICRGKETPLLKECGNKNLVFNTTSLNCEFKCIEEGLFPHPTDKKQFYICVYNGRILQNFVQTCRSGTIFDERYNFCVEDPNSQTTTEKISGTTTVSDSTDIIKTESTLITQATSNSDIQTVPTTDNPTEPTTLNQPELTTDNELNTLSQSTTNSNTSG